MADKWYIINIVIRQLTFNNSCLPVGRDNLHMDLKKIFWFIIIISFLGPILSNDTGKFLLILFIIIFIFKKLTPFKGGKWNQKNMETTIDVDKLKSSKNVRKMASTAVVIILLLWLFFASIVIVDAGETGVYSLFGKVKNQELSSGFHLVIPLARVTKMSVRTEEYTMSIMTSEGKKSGNDSIAALTKEGLNVDLDMTVLYRLDESSAADVYKKVGLTYEDKIIRPAIRTAIRDIIAQYDAKDIYSEKREEATQKIKEKLEETINQRGIVIEDILLRNVQLPANLANSIQEKLQAEQETQKYDFLLTKEAKEKERKIIEAEGQRESQRIINQSLTQNYLYYSYINELKDREGTIYVPTSPSTGMPLFRNLGN